MCARQGEGRVLDAAAVCRDDIFMIAVLIILYLLAIGWGYWLKYLNLSYLKEHGNTIPAEFRGTIDPSHLQKITAYTVENSRMGIVESIAGNVLLLVFLFGGVLAAYDRWIASLTGSFITAGVLFVLVLLAAQTVIDIPFSLYRNFRIENRYGFNTMSVKLWSADLAKSFAIAALLGTLATAAALSIIQASPAWWWLWVWIFLLIFGIFLMYVSPYVIEPLFFKFGPVKAEGLEERIRLLMGRAGLTVSRVFQVDASRRSRHSNAYFTGIGRVKRIVLFDTLIEQMTQDEILAVLAHEVGHWKKRHVLKRMVLTEASAFLGMLVAFSLLRWDGLPGMIGLPSASFYARTVIVGFLASLAMFPLTPFFSYFSRKNEREADHFASDLTGNPGAMASALVKLSRENLSNLHPHPLYAKFYYSHPPVVERIRALKDES
jgi:STE24 endopeptidase